ncbi:MAG: hypothetical protein WCO51_06870 [bacterium]|jgi:hypothetical protein
MLKVTQGPVDFGKPNDQPDGKVWRYGIGEPFQIAPRLAGVFVNIRSDYEKTWDFEAGTDIILFDDLSNTSQAKIYPVSRNYFEPDPETGENKEMTKYPVLGGFIPYGAKRADGSLHPHAGTGFGVSQVIGYSSIREKIEGPKLLELIQFAFDGKDLNILSKEMMSKEYVPGLTSAIPDGEDLLFTMSHDDGSSGVTRWKHCPDGWHMSDYNPVQGAGGTEPSLIRDIDGSFLYNTRKGFDILVWRSTDLVNWTQIINAERIVAGTPITLNQAPDGTPYIVSCHHQEMYEHSTGGYSFGREILCLWPLNNKRNGLEPGIVVRMPPLEFGAPPSNTFWFVDHPIASTVQLADGEWHNVLAYRIMELTEMASIVQIADGEGHNVLTYHFKGLAKKTHDFCINDIGNPPIQTGCYLEEVISDGPSRATWNF